METFDCTEDFQQFIPGSGVAGATIEVDGILDPALPEELHEKLLDAELNGDSLPVRFLPVTTGDKRFEGEFIPHEYERSSQSQDAETFKCRFESNGRVGVK